MSKYYNSNADGSKKSLTTNALYNINESVGLNSTGNSGTTVDITINSNNESDGSNSTGRIVGIAVGVAVLLIAAAVIILYLHIWRKRRLNKIAL